MAISVEPGVRYCKLLMVGGMQMLLSVSTGDRNAVVRQVWWCVAIQTLMNCHSQLEEHLVADLEPVKFIVQYLTQATVKLPSTGDDACSSVQHAVTCPLLSLVHQQEQCCSNQSVNSQWCRPV